MPTVEATTVNDTNAVRHLRRSGRSTQTTKHTRSSTVTLLQPPQAVSAIDMTLVQNLPQDTVSSYRAVVDTAHLDGEWHTCVSRWLLVESQNKQVRFRLNIAIPFLHSES